MNEDTQTSQAPKSLGKITIDQEAWLKDRLTDLVNLCDSIRCSYNKISANDVMVEKALEGAIVGQALEILSMLNLETENVNLPQRSWWVKDRKRGFFGTSILAGRNN